MPTISRNYADCATCVHKGKWSKCSPCDIGQNYEPKAEQGLDFDEPSFMDQNWGSEDE
jgi:hypothetical protein